MSPDKFWLQVITMFLVQMREIYYKIKHVLLKTKRKKPCKNCKGKILERYNVCSILWPCSSNSICNNGTSTCVYCKAFFTLGLYIKISIYGPITEMSINFNRSEMQIFLFCTSPILLPQPHCPSSIHKSVLQEYVQIFENEIQS